MRFQHHGRVKSAPATHEIIQSGQYIIQNIAARLELLKSISIHWIPSHIGITDNEAADFAAKEATGLREKGLPAAPIESNPILVAAARTGVRLKIKEQWANTWHEGTTGRRTHRFIKEPTNDILTKFNNLTRKQSSVIIQARTGKIGLRSYREC